MSRLLLPIFCAFSCALCAQAPFSKGLLWEISGNGLSKPGYLYGTMHVPEKLAFNLSDSFFTALRRADVVALETNHDEWQSFTEILDERELILFGAQMDNYSENRLSTQSDLYGEVFEFPTPDNRLLSTMLSAKPRLTNEFLYRSSQSRQDYEEDTYLDLFIFQAGRKLGKKVIGLESLEGSYEALVRAQLPDEPEEQNNYRFRAGYEEGSLEDAYREQDLQRLDSLNKVLQPGKNFQRWMQDERNAVMLHRIDSILQSGSSLFSAVGAAHLPGKLGLLQRLRDKGYTLRPVQFSANDVKTEKERIEALRVPVSFGRQWAPDSSWSVEAPGRFFQTADVSGLQQYLCADMSNGAYYAVYQLLSYGAWNGETPEYMAARIDSLIYEKVPGKIQERRRLTEPFPGHEITTRTRRGDVMRLKIFATPLCIYLFLTGGNGDYALGGEATRFLNSVRFSPPPRAGQEIHPPEGGFHVRFPGPLLLNTSTDKKADRFLLAGTDLADDSALYLLYRADFHDWSFIEEDSFELNILTEKIARPFCKNPPRPRLLGTSPYPTQEISFRADKDSAWYFLRLVIDGPHYYLLACRKNTAEAPDRFFNSFTIEPARYADDWQTLRDTSLFFEADIPSAAAKTENPFLEKLRRIISEGFRKNKSEFVPLPQNLLRHLRSPLHGDEILVQVSEISTVGGPSTIDSFQAAVKKRLSNHGALKVREQQWERPSARLLVGHFLLEDTNSTRGIRAKVLLTPGRRYTLRATVNLDAPENPFVRRAFDSFVPTDTTGGVLPFGRRDLSFFQQLYASDSLVRDKALEKLQTAWTLYFDDADFPALRDAIGHRDFGKLTYRHRADLLGLLGRFHSEEALNFALAFASRRPDSLRYQQTLMVALARMQTRASFESLCQRLGHEWFFPDASALDEISDSMRDTLPLAAVFLPKLMPLAEYEDMRDLPLELLDAAYRKGLVPPKRFARLKPQLIRESNLILWRMQYRAEEKKDGPGGEYPTYMPSYNSDRTPMTLERNLRLLKPFLHRDPQVRAVFRQALRNPQKEVRIFADVLLLSDDKATKMELLRPYAEDDRTRFILYRRLADAGLLGRGCSWFADTTALLRALLWDRQGDELDSVKFRSAHRTVRAGSPSLLYFFDVKLKKNPAWKLAFVDVPVRGEFLGYQPRKEGHYSFSPYRPVVKIMTDLPARDEAEFIREKIGASRFAGRERYRGKQTRPDYPWEE